MKFEDEDDDDFTVIHVEDYTNVKPFILMQDSRLKNPQNETNFINNFVSSFIQGLLCCYTHTKTKDDEEEEEDREDRGRHNQQDTLQQPSSPKMLSFPVGIPSAISHRGVGHEEHQTNSEQRYFSQQPNERKSPRRPTPLDIVSNRRASSFLPMTLTDLTNQQKSMHKKTIVLDLDETLIHSSFKPLETYSFSLDITLNNKPTKVFVLKRPGLDEFLQECCRHFEVVIFTASIRAYANPVMDYLDQFGTLFSIRLFREHCSYKDGSFFKDLSLLGRDLSQVVIVDNSPMSYSMHPRNALPISTWFDDPKDLDLARLTPVLKKIAEQEHVYDILMDLKKNNYNNNNNNNNNNFGSYGQTAIESAAFEVPQKIMGVREIQKINAFTTTIELEDCNNSNGSSSSAADVTSADRSSTSSTVTFSIGIGEEEAKIQL